MAVKVLILEDNPVARTFLCRVVRECFSDELELVEARDLESARRAMAAEAASAQPFQLLLIGLQLLDGSGLELLTALASHPALKVATALYADDERLFPALQCGASGYLLKEDRFEVLVEELQKIVRGQPPLSPAIARQLLTHFRDHAAPVPALSPGASGLQAPTAAQTLTPRESDVLSFLSRGFTNKEIAGLMGIGWSGLSDHIRSIYRKLDASSRGMAAVLAGAGPRGLA